jgi:hypoxanthine-guanine phosphoribosyltransferase
LQIPDRFVVGYGLDHDGRLRNLPYIAAMDEG